VWWTEGFEEHAPALRGLLRPTGGPEPDIRA